MTIQVHEVNTGCCTHFRVKSSTPLKKVITYMIKVLADYIGFDKASGALGWLATVGLFGTHHRDQLLQRFSGDNLVLKNDFKTVVGGRVVACGDHDAIAALVAMMHGKIQCWCGDFTEIDNIAAAGH